MLERWKKADLVISSSSANEIKSRESATFAARNASSLQEARIEKVDGGKVSAHEATRFSGNDATQRPSASLRSSESINTYRSPSTSSTGSRCRSARVNSSFIRKASSGKPASEMTRTHE